MKQILRSRPVRFVLDVADLYFTRRVSRSAAELAYFLILSFFPVLICVNAFVGLLDLDAAALVAAASPILPAAAEDILSDYLLYIGGNQSAGLLAAGIAMTLFSASAAFRSLMNIMADLYGRKGYTGLWQVVASVVFSVLLLVTVYASIVVVLTGEWLFELIQNFLHLDRWALPWDWQWLRFLLLFALVFLLVLVVYRLSAPRGERRVPLVGGAALASAALVAASVLFSWFISLSSRYSLVYGSLASVVILLVWLYLCGNVLILGNVFNCVRYRYKKERM